MKINEGKAGIMLDMLVLLSLKLVMMLSFEISTTPAQPALAIAPNQQPATDVKELVSASNYHIRAKSAQQSEPLSSQPQTIELSTEFDASVLV